MKLNTIMLSTWLNVTEPQKPEVKRVLYFIEELSWADAMEAMEDWTWNIDEEGIINEQ